MSQQAHEKQLHMLWPERLLHSPPPVVVPAGYALRTLRDEDKPGHLRVMAEAGFDQWNEQALEQWLFRVLPDGFFVVVHRASGQVVATAMATHNPSELHPYGGELGWVAASPQHAGRGLGIPVCRGHGFSLAGGVREAVLAVHAGRVAQTVIAGPPAGSARLPACVEPGAPGRARAGRGARIRRAHRPKECAGSGFIRVDRYVKGSILVPRNGGACSVAPHGGFIPLEHRDHALGAASRGARP